MILRRPIELFYWLSLFTIFLSGCTSIEKNQRGANKFSARSVLKSWRRKAQEQSARLFDRLPQNPEVFYTPVKKKKNLLHPNLLHPVFWFLINRIIKFQPEVIRNRGYPVEVHHITTDDGSIQLFWLTVSLSDCYANEMHMLTLIRYILEIHRIPAQSSGGPKKAVFLQHGVLESSGTWIVNPSSRSLRKYFKN